MVGQQSNDLGRLVGVVGRRRDKVKPRCQFPVHARVAHGPRIAAGNSVALPDRAT